MKAGVWGGWPHGVYSQESGIGISVHGTISSTLSQGFSSQSNLSKKALIDMFRVMSLWLHSQRRLTVMPAYHKNVFCFWQQHQHSTWCRMAHSQVAAQTINMLPSGVILVSVACAAAKGHECVHGPCCDWKPCGCLHSLLSPENILKSVVHAATGCHVDVCGPCCHQKPCASPWSLLPLSVMGKGSYFCSGFDDCRVIVEDERHRKLLWHIPPKEEQSRQEETS